MQGNGVQIADASGSRVGWRRPVALPDNVDEPSIEKAHGLVRLPAHLWWSGADTAWDLNDLRQRLQVYEIVLTEGTDDDTLLIIIADRSDRVSDCRTGRV